VSHLIGGEPAEAQRRPSAGALRAIQHYERKLKMGDVYDNLTNTPLIDAVINGRVTRVKELIDSGADINQPGAQGWTPLNWAAGKGNLEIVTLLVENGADVFKVGRDRRTPNTIALAAGHAAVVLYLRHAEEAATGKNSMLPLQYSKAYRLHDLRQFPNWEEQRIEDSSGDEDEVVFLHHDYTVSRSIWSNENVVFNNVTPEWKEFCNSVLEFRVPDPLDLVVTTA
jgi:uncharacterized protein